LTAFVLMPRSDRGSDLLDSLREQAVAAQRVARRGEVGSLNLAAELDALRVDGAVGEGRHPRLRYRRWLEVT
jgi:hypothetical protein